MDGSLSEPRLVLYSPGVSPGVGGDNQQFDFGSSIHNPLWMMRKGLPDIVPPDETSSEYLSQIVAPPSS